nr:O-antigen ligase family protein [uncultured Flavobacterium sp.]
MDAIIQQLGFFFLVLTTFLTVIAFQKSTFNGFTFFMYFLILSGFLGFARPILFEEISLPLLISFSMLPQLKNIGDKVNLLGILLLLYSILLTLINSEATFDGFEKIYLFGFILISFSNCLFSKELNFVKTLTFIWLYSLSRTLWLLIHGGAGLFSLYDTSDEGNRVLQVESGLSGNASIFNIDPNYLGYITGIGMLLSFSFYTYNKSVKNYFTFKFVKTKWFLYLVILVGVIELWLTVRALSRGMILALFAGLLTYLIVERKIKNIIIFLAFVFVFFLIFRDFINITLSRFNQGDRGGGRYDIWEFIWNYIQDNGRLLFGFGLNYPWWQDWLADNGNYLGTHNSWLSIILALGIFGFLILFIMVIKSIYMNFKENSIFARIRLILLAFIIVSFTSIEPLLSTFGWILLAVSTSYKIDNNKYEK